MSAHGISTETVCNLDETLRILGLPFGLGDADDGTGHKPLAGLGLKNYIGLVMAGAVNDGALTAEIAIFNARLRATYGPAVERIKMIKGSLIGEDISRMFLGAMQDAGVSLNAKMVLGQVDKWARKDGTYRGLAAWLSAHSLESLGSGLHRNFMSSSPP